MDASTIGIIAFGLVILLLALRVPIAFVLAAVASVGMDVVLLGPMPTPAVAMLTRSMRADLGVMISASHNPFADNGIKLFGPDGYKLSDKDEAAIERRLEQQPKLAKAELIGRAKRIDDARGRYVDAC